MKFEWDINKERYNIRRHGISFTVAAKVFDDCHVIVKFDDTHSSLEEERWNAIGTVEDVLFVVFTELEEDHIRIISARAAEKEEIDEYYSNYDA